MSIPKLIFIFILATLYSRVSAQDYKFVDAEKLGDEINSEYEESAPVFLPEINVLYFTRALHPENKGGETAGQDIWMSELQGDRFSVATNEFPELNNLLNNAVIGASKTGKRLFLLSTYEKKLKLQKGFSYSYAADGVNFNRPTKLDVDGLVFKSEFYGGSIHVSGDILLISMNSKDSKGEEDLYVSFKEGENGWSEPIHLGDSINTSGYEISPFLSEDKQTLFFGSNGHGGLGDCDIFYATRLDSSWTNWSKPKNLGAPVNSSGFDAFPYVFQEVIYFASNRDAEFSDIYRARNDNYFVPVEPVSLSFQTPTYKPKNLKVKVSDSDDKEIGTFSSDTGNVVSIQGLAQNKQYKIQPEHDLIDPKYLEAYVLNDSNQPVEALAFDESGEMKLKAKPKEELNKQKPVTIPEPELAAKGVFEFNGVPVRYLTLALVDSNELASQYTMTDENGYFAFARTRTDFEFFIQTLTELEYIQNEGDLYYVDDKNSKLFKAKKIKKGIFEHRQLTETELAQLAVLKELKRQSRMEEKPKQITEGVFKYEDLPKEGVKLYLVDENDNIVDSVMTDAQGKFKFEKLAADKSFSIKVANAEDSEIDAAGYIYFLDPSGNEVNMMKQTDDFKTFVYEPLSPELQSGLDLLEAEDTKYYFKEEFVFSAGLFKYNNLPKSGVTLTLLDASDYPLETVTTDGNGHFIFSMLRSGQDYSIRVDESNGLAGANSQIYIVGDHGLMMKANESGDKTGKFEFKTLSSDYFFSLKQINNGEIDTLFASSFKTVKGKFLYQNLPKEGVTIYLVDENENIIDSIVTGADGAFKFEKLARDGDYSIRFQSADEAFIDASAFVMENEDEQEVVAVKQEDGSFEFQVLPRDAQSLAMNSASDSRINASQYITEEEQAAEEEPAKNIRLERKEEIRSSGPDLPSNTDMLMNNELKMASIYFNFNSVRLSTRDRYRLNEQVVKQIKRSGQPILLLGYTCDIGDEASNVETSEKRAEEVKQFLINMGVDESMIEVHAVGQAISDLDEEDESMRALSRRVDIFHLGP